MKDDAPIPAEIPRKRRQLEAVPDVWLAEWLGGAYPLVPSQKARLEAEKARRRDLRRSESRSAAVITGPEGQTPQQKAAVAEALTAFGATEVHRPRGALDARAQIRAGTDLVIATPREATSPGWSPVDGRSVVWIAIDYAKHRRVPVKIIMPDGKEGTL